MHEPAGVVENLVQILQFTPILQYRIPPPPENCQKSWHFDFSVAEYPPPWKIQISNFFPKSKLEWLKIWSKFYSLPLFCNTEYPPPENCQKSWHFDFSVAEYPPPPPLWKIQISNFFPKTKSEVADYPPPLENPNCQKSWHFDFSVAEYPPPLKFRHFLVLCDFSVAEYPPPLPRPHTILTHIHYAI